MRKQQKSLYEKDFVLWADTQAKLLKKGQINLIDIDNLIEEIESLSKSDKKAIYNHLINWFMHKLKWDYQSEKRTKSWERTINNSRRQILLLIKFSPSLKNHLKKYFLDAYQDAREDAAKETKMNISNFPAECPWTIKDLFDK